MAINPYVPTSPASTVPEATPILAYEAKTDIEKPPRSFVSPDIHQDHSSVNIHDEQRTIKKKKKKNKKKYSQKEESGGREGTTSASTTENDFVMRIHDPDSGVLSNVWPTRHDLVSTQDLTSVLSDVYVSNRRLMGDNLTHNSRPHARATVITGQSSLIPSAPGYIGTRKCGQSSIACTTAPDSWLVTAPMSRSLPSPTCNTVASISEKDILLDTRDVYCYGNVPDCRSEPCADGSVSGRSDTVNEEYHTLIANCSSGGQSHHPTPQIVGQLEITESGNGNGNGNGNEKWKRSSGEKPLS